MSAVLDAGALVAVDKRNRALGARLRVLQRDAVPVLTSAGAVAQVWRDGRRQANLARVLPGVDVAALDELSAKKVGALLREDATNHIVDAHVALLVQPNGLGRQADDDLRATESERGLPARRTSSRRNSPICSQSERVAAAEAVRASANVPIQSSARPSRKSIRPAM